MTDGYDSPVGDLAERCGADITPGKWIVALGYGTWYKLSNKYPSIHTGADIELEPYGGYGQPIYAVADGVVTCSRDIVGSTWRNLVVIRHVNRDDSVLCSRYGHLKVRSVKVGDAVSRGQPIGELGNADGAFAPHLHFDLSPGETLTKSPTNWPGDDLTTVRRLYVDPIAYIKEHRPVITDQIIALAKQIETLATQLQPTPPAPPAPDPHPDIPADAKELVATNDVKVRTKPTTDSPQLVVNGQLAWVRNGATVRVKDLQVVANGHPWGELFDPYVGYVALDYFTPKA